MTVPQWQYFNPSRRAANEARELARFQSRSTLWVLSIHFDDSARKRRRPPPLEEGKLPRGSRVGFRWRWLGPNCGGRGNVTMWEDGRWSLEESGAPQVTAWWSARLEMQTYACPPVGQDRWPACLAVGPVSGKELARSEAAMAAACCIGE